MKLKFLPFIGLAIFTYLIYKVGLSKIYQSFSGLKYQYIPIAILILFLTLFLLATKWNLILRKQGTFLPMPYLFKIYMIGVFYGAITPSKVGSLLRASYLKKRTGKSIMLFISSIVLERLLDIFTILFYSFISLIILSKAFNPELTKNYILPTIIATIILILGTYILLNKNLAHFFFQKFGKLIVPKKYKDKTDELFDNFYSMILKPSQLILPLLFAIANWFVVFIFAYCISLAFSIKVPFLIFCSAYTLGTLVGTIPITVSGVGTREVILILILGAYGVDKAAILSMAIVNLTLALFIPALIGFLFSLKEKENVYELQTSG